MTVLDKLSFQMYSARKFPPLEDHAAELARIGYRMVEPYGGLLAEPDALVSSLTKHGLTAPTVHIGLANLQNDLDGAVRVAKEIGTGIMIVPAVPPEQRTNDAAGWRKLGETLADRQAALKAHGLRMAWHNHAFEFVRLDDGSHPLDHIFAGGPELLWQVDIAWIIRGDQEPNGWMRKYADRIVSIHLKDIAPEGECVDEDGWADVGYGTMDWAGLLKTIATTKTEVYVAEHDNPSDWKRFARRTYDVVKSWG
jgi:sugar phosphate isomerase/epimerase